MSEQDNTPKPQILQKIKSQKSQNFRLSSTTLDAIRNFRSFFQGNPSRYGVQTGFVDGSKQSETVKAPVTDDLIYQHLTLRDDVQHLALGVQRIGFIPVDENRMTIVGAIDVDLHSTEDAEEFRLTCESLENFVHDNQLVMYREKTLSGGFHYFLPSNQPIKIEEMRDALYFILASISRTGLETYPMGAKLEAGRWMYMPNAGALSNVFSLSADKKTIQVIGITKQPETYTLGLGRTFMETLSGKPISIFDLEDLEKNQSVRVLQMSEIGQRHREQLQTARDQLKGSRGYDDPMAYDISPDESNLESIKNTVLNRVPHKDGSVANIFFKRHDSLFCWLNIGRRMGSIQQVQDILSGQDVWEAWNLDGKRSYPQWVSEIERIAEKFKYYGTEDYGFEYGIKKLREMKWQVPDFAKLESDEESEEGQAKEKAGKQSNRSIAKRILAHFDALGKRIIYRPKLDTFYGWNGDYYTKYQKQELLAKIASWVEDKFGEGIAGALGATKIVEEMKLLLGIYKESPEDPSLINTSGGLLKWERSSVMGQDKFTLKRLERSQDDYLFSKFHANYNSEYAKPEEQHKCLFVESLRRTFWYLPKELQDDNITTIMEFIGYSMTGFMNAQKAMNLHGEAGTGKGLIITTMQKLSQGIGRDTVDADETPLGVMQFLQLGTDHALTQLEGKRVLFISEVDSSRDARASMITFKAIVGSDKISINPKYLSPYTYQPMCKVVFSSNSELYFGYDKSNDSITRRLVRIHFAEKLKMEDIDKDLYEKVTKDQEQLDRIFSIAMNMGLNFANNSWTNTRYNHEEAVESAKEDMNPLIGFVKTFLAPAIEFADQGPEILSQAIIKVAALQKIYNDSYAPAKYLDKMSPPHFRSSLKSAINDLNWRDLGVEYHKGMYTYLLGVFMRNNEEVASLDDQMYREAREFLSGSLTIEKIKEMTKKFAATRKGEEQKIKPDGSE